MRVVITVVVTMVQMIRFKQLIPVQEEKDNVSTLQIRKEAILRKPKPCRDLQGAF